MEKEIEFSPNVSDNNKALRYIEEILPQYVEGNDYSEVKKRFETWSELKRLQITSADKDRLFNSSVESYKDNLRLLSGNGINPLSWSDIDSLKFPENPWRIRNLLPLEGFVVLAGVSGEGKSFVSLEMANALTTPRDFINEESFSVVGTNVLYIDGEMSKSELQRRGRQMSFSDKREFEILFVNQDEVNLKDEDKEDLDDVIRIVEEKSIGVVFVDTLRAVAGAMEENKAEEVRKFFNRFKPLKDMGVCVVFLDHMRKGSGSNHGEPQKDNLFASQDKTASCEILLLLQKKPGDSTIVMYQRKNRLGEEYPAFDIVMHDTDMNSAQNKTTLEYFGPHNGQESKVEQSKEIVLNALASGDKMRKELVQIVKDEADIGWRTAQDAFKILQKSKLVDVTVVGKEHKYSLKPPETGVVEKKNV